MRLTHALAIALIATPAMAETQLTVMSYNIWGGGQNEGKDIAETVAVIHAAGADVVGLQETRLESDPCTAEACPATGPSVAADVAKALGWYHHDQTAENPALWANAVISRYPIGSASPHDLGVLLNVDGQTVWLFNIHLDDEPYGPYQVMGIPYGPAPFVTTEADAQDWSRRTRGPAMALLQADLALAAGAAAIFVTGDFNEPSGLDWTDATTAAGHHPFAVDWPTTRLLMDQGFVDAYRSVHPDPVARPAYTWTPTYDEAALDDHPDRIDFIFARGAGVRVTDAAIVGEDGPRSDIKVVPWPSDHRAVVARFTF